MSLTNKDIFGVLRGRCSECEDCKQYITESERHPPQLKCLYCSHSPGSHNKLQTLDGAQLDAAKRPRLEAQEGSSSSRGQCLESTSESGSDKQDDEEAVTGAMECLTNLSQCASHADYAAVEPASDTVQGWSTTESHRHSARAVPGKHLHPNRFRTEL
ncbi:uncharacterized protein LOC135397817 [Ornithodoros turicata]|uniref:uncharacterized protein LOC135397817 n=1 Tax=Ornithodoros turicata TaxID=34597 RepID=UPI0031388B28